MDTWVINEEGKMNVVATSPAAWLRLPALFISYLFHPLFLITYTAAYLIYGSTDLYLGAAEEKKFRTLLSILSSNLFLPLVTVLLLKGLGFAQSIQLKTQKERIIPYIACITFFFWSYYVARNLQYPHAMKGFLLGAFISVSAALLMNIYMKVSMHALAVGGVSALFAWLLLSAQIHHGFPPALAWVIAGITCTSRFLVSDHRAVEIYAGFIAGFFLQLIAFWIA